MQASMQQNLKQVLDADKLIQHLMQDQFLHPKCFKFLQLLYKK